MKFDPNDPKLTAYALGELEEAEKAEVEAMFWPRYAEVSRSGGGDSANRCRCSERSCKMSRWLG